MDNETQQDNQVKEQDENVLDFKSPKDLFEYLNKYKAAFSILAFSSSLILSNVWIFICNCWHYGYAYALQIDFQYVNTDWENMLVLCVVFLCISISFLFPIFLFVKWSIIHKKISIFIFICLVGVLFFLNFFPNCLSQYLSLFNIIIFIVSVTYFQILFLYRNISKLNTDKKENLQQNANFNFQLMLRNSVISIITELIIIIVLVFIGSFFYTFFIKNYRIIPNKEYNKGTFQEGNYDVLLSEKDDYYYLAKGKIFKSDKGLSLIIYINDYSISKKTDEINIVKYNFSEVCISSETSYLI